MKSCNFFPMSAGSQDTAIEFEPNRPSCEGDEYIEGMVSHSLFSTHRTHSRSQSLSLPVDAHQRTHQLGYSPDISSMYSISPFSNVFRDFVPSFVNMAQSSDPTNVHLSRTSHIQSRSSSGSSLSQGLRYEREETGNDHLSENTDERDRHEHVSLNMDTSHDHRQFHEHAGHETVDHSTLGLEISEGVRWMERNAVFIILLLLKFSYYHRYGKRL